MTNITVADKECWRCGEQENLTKHHTLPQHLKPKKNIIVPICEACHHDITADDITGLYAYIIKLERTFKSLDKQIKSIKTTLENSAMMKFKKK